MDEPLDELYFKWLYGQVASVRLKNPARTYWSLTGHMYKKRYVWFVPNDDNRVEDGRDLRYEFLKEHNLDFDPNWLELDCSFLEMLVGLARRLAFNSDETEPAYWFWHLLENIGLHEYSDLYYRNNFTEELVDGILDRVIWRTYKPNGVGGFFPLMNAREDQREVELWYQFSAYLLERE